MVAYLVSYHNLVNPMLDLVVGGLSHSIVASVVGAIHEV